MAKIYFNRPIIKHLEETTVINFFFQKDEDGDSIYIRDTRPDVYRDNYVVFGDIELYKKPGDPHGWNCDIVPMETPNYDILGFYTGEGVDFEILAIKEPVFRIRQKQVELALATVGYMHQGYDDLSEVTFGLFHLGTKIRFKRDGVEIEDELTPKGWVRRKGPDDHKFGIITVEEAYQEKLALEEKMKNPDVAKEMLSEEIERIRDAKSKKEIHPELADALIRFKQGEEGIHYFLAKDVKELIKKNIIV